MLAASFTLGKALQRRLDMRMLPSALGEEIARWLDELAVIEVMLMIAMCATASTHWQSHRG